MIMAASGVSAMSVLTTQINAAASVPSGGEVVLNAPIVNVAPTSTADGYWLVASDGGDLFLRRCAPIYGSEGGTMHLNQADSRHDATPDGKGYWLVASDGGDLLLRRRRLSTAPRVVPCSESSQ
jgi:hypothetical protein